jgi:hypothetical protein
MEKKRKRNNPRTLFGLEKIPGADQIRRPAVGLFKNGTESAIPGVSRSKTPNANRCAIWSAPRSAPAKAGAHFLEFSLRENSERSNRVAV